MFIRTCSFNQTQSTQDKTILSGQALTNTLKNIPILTLLKNDNALDEMPCLSRHTRAYTGTGVSMKAQDVSGKARTVPTINFYRAQTGNKVDIYKKLN